MNYILIFIIALISTILIELPFGAVLINKNMGRTYRKISRTIVGINMITNPLLTYLVLTTTSDFIGQLALFELVVILVETILLMKILKMNFLYSLLYTSFVNGISLILGFKVMLFLNILGLHY
jgi:hypothetical protein